ncbi:MAG: RICIN domain-containing protein [Gammaproteobacteria bacterium]|nr:RICIN domain-containing protein [Gammaproteobacteria bacterium]
MIHAHGGDNQKWYRDDFYRIRNLRGNLCLDTTATSLTGVVNGTGMQLAECGEALDQSWTMRCP